MQNISCPLRNCLGACLIYHMVGDSLQTIRVDTAFDWILERLKQISENDILELQLLSKANPAFSMRNIYQNLIINQLLQKKLNQIFCRFVNITDLIHIYPPYRLVHKVFQYDGLNCLECGTKSNELN